MTLPLSPATTSAQAHNLGLGLGLRNKHFEHILNEQPKVGWFEAISENFMDSGGRPRYIIKQLAERYPIVLHGVSMSIGSVDPLNFAYLKKLKRLTADVNARWVSDHLCWTGIHAMNSHDLLPLPLNEQTLEHVIARVHVVQDFLGHALVLENPSSYLSFEQSTLTEPAFFKELVDATDCRLLLDVNNVFVTGFNNDFDPVAYLHEFPVAAVVQIHLAGHTHCGTHIIDTHDKPVRAEVWDLYRLAHQLTGGVATLLEWDGNIPSFADCITELHKAKAFMSGNPNEDAVASPQEEVNDGLSTPIDFLVPDVMGGMCIGQSHAG